MKVLSSEQPSRFFLQTRRITELAEFPFSPHVPFGSELKLLPDHSDYIR